MTYKVNMFLWGSELFFPGSYRGTRLTLGDSRFCLVNLLPTFRDQMPHWNQDSWPLGISYNIWALIFPRPYSAIYSLITITSCCLNSVHLSHPDMSWVAETRKLWTSGLYLFVFLPPIPNDKAGTRRLLIQVFWQ